MSPARRTLPEIIPGSGRARAMSALQGPATALDASGRANALSVTISLDDEEQVSRMMSPSLLQFAQRWHEPGVVLTGV
jgi:hypothetical protein